VLHNSQCVTKIMPHNENYLNRGRSILLSYNNTASYNQDCQVSGFDPGGPVFESFGLATSPENTGLVLLYFPLWSTTFCEVSLVCVCVETINTDRKIVGYLRSTISLTVGILKCWTYTGTNYVSWIDVYFGVT
jgi:hypothetical protein